MPSKNKQIIIQCFAWAVLVWVMFFVASNVLQLKIPILYVTLIAIILSPLPWIIAPKVKDLDFASKKSVQDLAFSPYMYLFIVIFLVLFVLLIVSGTL